MKKNRKTGFTMIEDLVSLALMVIIVGLSAFLYARAARIRKLITYQSNVQNILNSMITEINFGSRDTIGLQYAYDIVRSVGDPPYELGFYDNTKGEYVFYLISPGMYSGHPSSLPTTNTDTSLWQAKTNSSDFPSRTSEEWKLIDINKSIVLASGSSFTYYRPDSTTRFKKIDDLTVETPIAVKIILTGKATDPSLRTRPPITATTMVRPKNKITF